MERNRNQSFHCEHFEGRLHSPFQGRETSLIHHSINSKPISRPSQRSCLKTTNRQTIAKRCNRRGYKYFQSRVLFQGISSSKEGRLETYNRSQSPEHLPRHPKIQDGDTRICQGIHSTRGMDYLNRPDRCLSPCANPSKVQEIPQIYDREKGVPIPCTTFWAGNSTLSIHQDSEGSKGILHYPGHHNPPISRRLDQQNFVLPTGSGKGKDTEANFRMAGILNQHQEIPVHSNTIHHIHWLPLQPNERDCNTTRREGHSPSKGNTLVSLSEKDYCEKPYACHRSSGSNREDGSLWQDPSEATATVSQQPMGLEDFIGVSNPSGQPLKRDFTLVEQKGKPSKRLSSPSKRSSSPDLFRCLKCRLGSPLSPTKYRRSVVPSRSKETHKCSGDEGCMVSPPTFQTPVDQQDSSVINRQFNSGLIHKQTGRHKVSRPLCSHLENINLDQEKQYNSVSQTHSRLPECNGRSPVQVTQSPQHRMVSESSDIQGNNLEAGDTKHRHVCNLSKQQVANICVTISRPCCVGNRCNVHKLDKSISLCISSNKSVEQDHIKDQERTVQSSSHSSIMASDALVSGSDEPNNNGSSQTTTSVVPPQTTSQGGLPSEPEVDATSRISDPILNLQNQGFEEKLATRIANPQRENTLKIYKGKWKIFLDWANLKQDEIHKISIPMIAKFLLYLFEEQKLQVATIDGYKTAIANQLKQVSPLQVATDEKLCNLIKSFYRDRPRNLRTLPHWDLSVVLNALSKTPYEPLADAQLKWLTLKTVFLVALASGKRRSEIHALIHNKVKYNRSDDSFSLGICPSFVAKNQVTRNLNEALRQIKIVGLRKRVGPDMIQERSNCPVRALCHYLDKTKNLRDTNQRKLFISFKDNFKKDICANTISGWLKYVIRQAYNRDIPDQDLRQLNITAHSVRSVAVSWAATGGASLDQILNACQWQSESSFTSFYLKEVNWNPTESRNTPFIAAQQIVTPNL